MVEQRDRRFHGRRSDPAGLEVVPNKEIARAPVRKRSRSRLGEPFIVDRACLSKTLDRLGAGCGSDPRLVEARVELHSREVAAPQGAGGPLHRLVALELPPEATGALAVQLDPDV